MSSFAVVATRGVDVRVVGPFPSERSAEEWRERNRAAPYGERFGEEWAVRVTRMARPESAITVEVTGPPAFRVAEGGYRPIDLIRAKQMSGPRRLT